MIDQLRGNIQKRLEQLLAEADKLRRALAALGGRANSPAPPVATTPTPPPPKPRSARTTSKARPRGRVASTVTKSAKASIPSAAASRQKPEPVTTKTAGQEPAAAEEAAVETLVAKRRGRTAINAPDAPARTTPGATKGTVLAALANGKTLTAGEIATVTGVSRQTVSTTLSRLAKAGELTKAERGYKLTESDADGQTA
jgi:DNA-binding transcriptional ArsR family regulator